MPGLQPTGQLAQGKWKCKQSLRQIGSILPQNTMPGGLAGMGVTEYPWEEEVKGRHQC